MQVKFQWVKFKNLLSYGNAETTVDLQSHSHTIITAKNGSGKSSILDAICYALFGKPYRNVKLGQLINSINKKNLVVTIQFTVGEDVFRVVRGQKPNIFEIYKNNELIPEDSSSRGYQEYLETAVLKFNFKTFKQIVIIGSASYKPFMDLTAAERRAITEDVLDIAIFSTMQDIAKAKLSEMKSLVDSLTNEINILRAQTESQKELVEKLTNENESKREQLLQRKQKAEAAIKELEESLAQIDAKIESLSSVSETHETLKENASKLQLKLSKIDSKIESLRESLAFYENAACPTCGQDITEEFREKKNGEVTSTICEHESMADKVREMVTAFSEKLTTVTAQMTEYSNLVSERRNVMYSLKTERAAASEIVIEDSSESLTLSKQKLRDLASILIEKSEQKNEATKSLNHHKVVIDILKDNGIKAKVIATFIPLLNELINEYLEMFDLFVSFELDETFNETIKSRDRDTFSYNSFSEGEKQKIDLAMLFSWRKIAMSRNSVSTNLLIFDETLDKSLDSESVDTFINILESIEDSVNTIVISHREVVPELFDRHITIKKVKDFSIMTIDATELA